MSFNATSSQWRPLNADADIAARCPYQRETGWRAAPSTPSAVSRIGIPQFPGRYPHPADRQSAIQQVANLRYGRLMGRVDVRASLC
jgi:hypothetical protein